MLIFHFNGAAEWKSYQLPQLEEKAIDFHISDSLHKKYESSDEKWSLMSNQLSAERTRIEIIKLRACRWWPIRTSFTNTFEGRTTLSILRHANSRMALGAVVSLFLIKQLLSLNFYETRLLLLKNFFRLLAMVFPQWTLHPTTKKCKKRKINNLYFDIILGYKNVHRTTSIIGYTERK